MKSPIYTLTPGGYVRAGAASLVGGVVMGVAWGLVLFQFQYGFLSIFLGVLLSFVFTRSLDFATRKKRGPVVVGFAAGGMAIAWGIQLLLAPDVGLFGLVALGVGIYLAYQHLIGV